MIAARGLLLLTIFALAGCHPTVACKDPDFLRLQSKQQSTRLLSAEEQMRYSELAAECEKERAIQKKNGQTILLVVGLSAIALVGGAFVLYYLFAPH